MAAKTPFTNRLDSSVEYRPASSTASERITRRLPVEHLRNGEAHHDQVEHRHAFECPALCLSGDELVGLLLVFGHSGHQIQRESLWWHDKAVDQLADRDLSDAGFVAQLDGWPGPKASFRSRPGHVFARTSVDLHPLSRPNKEGNLQHEPGLECRWLTGAGDAITLDSRLCLGDLKLD